MAGEKVRNISCWELHAGDLNIYLASTERGVSRVGLSMKKRQDCRAFFRAIFPSRNLIRSEEKNHPLVKSVEALLDNSPLSENVPFDISGTPFQRKVWHALREIPYGVTKTYGQVAEIIGKPGAARAIGQAVGRNPLPLFFP